MANDSKPERPWSGERRPLVPPRLAESLGLTLAVNEKTTYIRCKSSSDLEALVLGIAKLLPNPVRCFLLQSDDLSDQESSAVIAPLLAGESVVVAFQGASDLPGELNDRWSECSENPDGTTFACRNFVMRAVETPGFLATVHVLDRDEFIGYRSPIFRATPEEVAMLELVGRPSLISVRRLGKK